ncbi:hypothetical protein EXE58_06960 [Nocardioides seonyuensis]|uniref:Uncharacterized protein n=1 Tax=Nocardioides seonyuensis TaxID=2518371 RepID=A0A4P7IDH3_9ACTN|nr:hypothetical protein [Nocardioides seonyuensis]QBX55215.1 hypothetical protein EXE58_06960 [Nocardioides seonyuensis]
MSPAVRRLSVAVAVTAMVAAGLGLAFGGLYGDDEAAVQMLRGFDAVTLVVAGPALLLAIRSDQHGAPLGRLMVASWLAYLGYTFAYHLLGAGMTDLLLLHAVLVTTTLVALGFTLSGVVADPLADRVGHVAVRLPGVVLGLLSVALGAMWAYGCIAYAVDGTVPAGSSLVESDAIVHLGIVLDLTILVPLYATAAVLLWRRLPWGFVLAALALVPGTLHQVSYVVSLLFQSAADVPGAVWMDPFEPVILLLYLVATAALLRRPAARRPG